MTGRASHVAVANGLHLSVLTDTHEFTLSDKLFRNQGFCIHRSKVDELSA
jgi:hypothetical protein